MPSWEVVFTQQKYEQLATIYKQLHPATDFLLKQSLKHPEPEYRYVGLYVIAVRGKPFHNDLLYVLEKDEHCDVQQAARFALVALARKKSMKHIDFGPLPGATQEQVVEAIQEWQRWWNPYKLKK